MLAHYDPQLLACDASPYGLGAVLAHCYPGGSEKLAYGSHTLSDAENNYSQIEKKGLACVFGVKHFHLYLYGRSFTLAIDHKPLLSLFGAKKPSCPTSGIKPNSVIGTYLVYVRLHLDLQKVSRTW